MAMQRIEQLLRRTIGLDCASIGSTALQRAVRERLGICLIPNAETYWDLLCASEAELLELIEAVVVPETWFFRDRGAFSALADLARSVWLRGRPDSTLRLLSLPCATGEEPYSMAMALLEEDVAADRFRIDAVDVSARALERARQAVFGRNSFRSADLRFRDRYFEPAGQGHFLNEPVRRQVRFERGNLLAPDFIPGAALYDAIFCRNVLIYFDRAAQVRAIETLSRLLKPAGALFVAPAEAALLHGHGFSPLHWPRAYAFHKSPVAKGERAVAPIVPPVQSPMACPAPATTISSPAVRATPPVAATVTLTADASLAAGKITRLADQGRLEEAAQACELHLREFGPSAQILYLLGLVHDAAGRAANAAQHYRQALYLDPTHRPALAHLALMLDKQGDAPAAQVLRGRIRRLEQAHGR